MEVALNSMVTSTQMRSPNSAMTTALPSANFRADSSGIVDFFNSNSRGFENGKVLTSSNGLALLASLTLKKALNVGNVYSQTQHKNSNIVSILPTSNVYSFNNITAAAAATTSRTTSTTTTAKITSSSNNSLSLPTSSPASQSKSKNKDANVTSVATITKSSSSTAVTASMTTNTKHGIATASAITAKTTSTTTTAISNNSNNNNSNSRHNFQIPSDILDDLASRFIINVPDMELSNLIRICFQIELAHWFYLDFFCASDEEKKLKPCGIKQFAMQLFQHIPFLHEHLSSVDKILEDWKNYKLSVPTYGAILISEDLNYCLLVQSYFSKSSWGFPKGKVNENEDPEHCAAREVYEETGYDITELIVPNDYIEAVINYQFTRLYIVRNVSLQTQFSPRTRNEIKCCDWFPIDSLPAKKNDAISKTKLGINANSFFMIMPFVKRLKKWVNDIRTGIESRRKFPGGGGICNGGGENASPTANLVSVSNTSTTATTALVSGNFNNNNNNLNNINNSNNQKHLNANSNCKKNKQQKQNIDEKNALRSDIAVVGAGGGGLEGGLRCNGNGNAANTLTNSSSAAATASATLAATATITSSNRSKRQRHKSMGDLDGIKLNNLSHNNISNQSNCKFNGASANSNVGATTIITTTTITSSSSSTTTTANAVANNNNNNCNQNSNLIVGNNNNNNGVNGNGSNQKRNLLKIVAGSNTNNNNTNNNNNNNNNNSSNNNNNINNNLNGISGNHVSTTKRQLFHNQNQNGGEKIISSFDLIRKEKQQQMKAAAQAERTSKAQKQQQQQQINGRVRAKSQGDKMCMQPQQLQQQINNNLNNINNSTNNKNNSKQRGQKQQQQQQTMIINNTTTNMSANNNMNINNQMHISTANNTVNGYVTPPPPQPSLASASAPAPATPTTLATPATLAAPAATTTASSHLSGVELIALAASAAAAKASPTTKRQNSEVVLHKSYSSAPNTVQKPRPSSVSLHYATTPSLNCDGDITAMQQLQRMASVTNLRILKRATSHQPQLQHQLEQHQQLKFTPNFNSWTNFSFTKNFIANVFC